MSIDRKVRAAAIMVLLIVLAINLSGCGPKEVLLYDDSTNHFARTALDRLNYAYLEVNTWGEFVTAFQAKAWDLLVMDNPSAPDPESGGLPLIDDFVTRGARAVISTMNIGQYPSMALWATLGYHKEGESSLIPKSIYKINATETIWKRPNAAPELIFADADDNYSKNGFPGSTVGSGVILAVFSVMTPATNAALIEANEGRTLLNSFLLDDGVHCAVPIDTDGDSVADSVEWWMNEIRYVSSQPGESIMPEWDEL